MGDGRFVEICVNCPLEVCEVRDPKGMYARAKRGEIPKFTGVSAPYEPPESPEIEVRTDLMSVRECAQKVVEYLEKEKSVIS